MAVTRCIQQMKEGVLDMEYIERRLDAIEARLDDLCGLLGSVLDALGVSDIDTTPKMANQMDLNLDGIWDGRG